MAPVAANVAVARWARSAGHTVIIHTSRIASDRDDVCRLTLDTLRTLDIPYDELIFGKPLADVYFDDRAVNPFINSPRAMGLPIGDVFDAGSIVPNALPNNRYNTLRVENGCVVKRGPEVTMRGEAFFYEAVRSLGVAALFPAFFGRTPQPQQQPTAYTALIGGSGEFFPAPSTPPLLEITLELVKCVPLTTIMRAQLLAPYHLDAVVAALRTQVQNWGARR